jgi:glucose-1-phosphate cytidylyltransferase
MKAVILAGGLGTRISEESHLKPKPMIEIGGKPIIWHIMKIYSAHGINDFVVCLGYRGYVVKEYFANYFLHNSDVTFDIANNKMVVHEHTNETWKVTLVDTGVSTMTGGRLKRIAKYVGDEDFCFTYGDGVSDINITELVKFHREHGKLASVTAVQPPGRFGTLEMQNSTVLRFAEKLKGDNAWINGGFFVLNSKVLSYIDNDDSIWEREPVERLAEEGNLQAFKHDGFWQPLDTLRDKMFLEQLWNSGKATWKVW